MEKPGRLREAGGGGSAGRRVLLRAKHCLVLGRPVSGTEVVSALTGVWWFHFIFFGQNSVNFFCQLLFFVLVYTLEIESVH